MLPLSIGAVVEESHEIVLVQWMFTQTEDFGSSDLSFIPWINDVDCEPNCQRLKRTAFITDSAAEGPLRVDMVG